MTQRSLPVCMLVACVCSWPGAWLRAQQAPPVDPKAVLATLKDLRTKQPGIINQEKANVLAAIKAAIADPVKTYEQALASVEQQGAGTVSPTRPNDSRPGPHVSGAREVNRAAELRNRQNEQFRDRDFVNGLRLQLVYLSLTWQRSMGAKNRELIPALLDYTTQVNNNTDELSKLEMYRKPITESAFVNYFQVGPYINGLPEWSDRAFDVESIFQKTILPELRKAKDPRLLDYWDSHLQSEAVRASATQNNLTISKFNHIRRPSLLWSRAEDEQVLGNGNQAVADMLALIKANPDHPDFDKWASELEGIVSAKIDPVPTGEVTVGPAGPATLVTPTPGLVATPAPPGR